MRVTDNPHIRIFAYDRNQGKGSATKHGMKYVTVDLAVLTDSDTDVKPILVKKYASVLRDNDVALASRWRPRRTPFRKTTTGSGAVEPSATCEFE